MSEKKAARILTLLVVLCLIVGMAPAVAAAGAGTGFSIETSSSNENFNAYWKNVDIYTLFNSVERGGLLTGWSSSSGYLGLYLDVASSVSPDYPIIRGAYTGYLNKGSFAGYTVATYPLGSIEVTADWTTSSSNKAVFCNYYDAYMSFSVTGTDVYFLTPDSYLQAKTTNPSKYLSCGVIYELGYIATSGEVTYGKKLEMNYGTALTSSRTFFGLYYLPTYLTSDDVSLVPNGYTVAAGVEKMIPCWLTTSTEPYNDPSIGWSIRVISPLGVEEPVTWASIDSEGFLHLTADSVAGYDIEITATWGDGISKSAPLYVRDLGDPGGSDPEIPETGVVERAEFLALQADVQALQEQVDEMPDRIAESMEQVLDQEKNEADQGGNENVGDLTDAIPDYSEGFMDALRDFASSMVYSGTDAVLPIPAIVFPEIGGLVPSFTLLEANSLDFGQVFQIVPDTVMKLVQALLTIALIVYCFKELYGTISYVLTLRGGGA